MGGEITVGCCTAGPARRQSESPRVGKTAQPDVATPIARVRGLISFVFFRSHRLKCRMAASAWSASDFVRCCLVAGGETRGVWAGEGEVAAAEAKKSSEHVSTSVVV